MNTAIYRYMRRRITANYFAQEMQEVYNRINGLLIEFVNKAQ